MLVFWCTTALKSAHVHRRRLYLEAAPEDWIFATKIFPTDPPHFSPQISIFINIVTMTSDVIAEAEQLKSVANKHFASKHIRLFRGAFFSRSRVFRCHCLLYTSNWPSWKCDLLLEPQSGILKNRAFWSCTWRCIKSDQPQWRLHQSSCYICSSLNLGVLSTCVSKHGHGSYR